MNISFVCLQDSRPTKQTNWAPLTQIYCNNTYYTTVNKTAKQTKPSIENENPTGYFSLRNTNEK